MPRSDKRFEASAEVRIGAGHASQVHLGGYVEPETPTPTSRLAVFNEGESSSVDAVDRRRETEQRIAATADHFSADVNPAVPGGPIRVLIRLVVRSLGELTPPAFRQGKVSEQLVGRFVGSRRPRPFRPAALHLGESFAPGNRAWIHERNGNGHP
mgnify:CR=1 FL=1